MSSGSMKDAAKQDAIPEPDMRQDQWKNMLLSNKFKNQPAMIIYTSGTTGRPKVRLVWFVDEHFKWD